MIRRIEARCNRSTRKSPPQRQLWSIDAVRSAWLLGTTIKAVNENPCCQGIEALTLLDELKQAGFVVCQTKGGGEILIGISRI